MEKVIEFIKEHLKVVVTSLLIVVSLGIFYFFSQGGKSQNTMNTKDLELVSSSEKSSSSEKIKESSDQLIRVDLKGAVQKPAVYQLPKDSRVEELLKLAGGLLETADQNAINLAAKLKDEEVIYVPTKEEKAVPVAGKKDSTTTAKEGNVSSSSSEKVKINSADLKQIQTLSGIGAKRAQDIIDYREANGPFKSLEDLGKVSGIGPKKLEKLKDSIIFD